MEYEAIAVGREHKGNIQRDSVIQRLLHPVTNGKGVVLGLDDGNRNVMVIQDVIGPLGLAPRDQLAPDDNPTLGEEDFAANLECLVPSGLNQGWCDELGADVGFAQGLFAHDPFFVITFYGSRNCGIYDPLSMSFSHPKNETSFPSWFRLHVNL